MKKMLDTILDFSNKIIYVISRNEKRTMYTSSELFIF